MGPYPAAYSCWLIVSDEAFTVHAFTMFTWSRQTGHQHELQNTKEAILNAIHAWPQLLHHHANFSSAGRFHSAKGYVSGGSRLTSSCSSHSSPGSSGSTPLVASMCKIMSNWRGSHLHSVDCN